MTGGSQRVPTGREARRSRRGHAGRALLVLSLVVPAALWGQDSRERLEEMERAARRALEGIAALRDEKRSILGEIESADRTIERRRAEIVKIDREAQDAAHREAEAREAIERLEGEAASLRGVAVGRIRGLHRLHNQGWGPVVLRSAASLSDALRFRRYLQAALHRDREIFGRLQRSQESVEAERTVAENAAITLAALRDDRSREVSRLRARRAAKESLLQGLDREGKERELALAELEVSATELREWLESEASAPPMVATDESSSELALPLEPPLGGIRLARNGVEIDAPEGALVRAILEGRIAYADWFPGYGKMVIVDHGEHRHSVYASVGELLVRAGESVERAEGIARVGTTGLASTPRLYFEVRRGGQAEAPEKWIPALAAR